VYLVSISTETSVAFQDVEVPAIAKFPSVLTKSPASRSQIAFCKTMSATMLSGFLFFFFLLSVVNADKDISYYNANHGNPNVDLKMYWKDAENILDDLSQFSSLHVQFHSCEWSYIYDDEGSEEAEDGSDTWYMGSAPSMGANVAFSLYGSLAGEKFKGCSATTFINSFYTNTGLYDFATAMQYASVSFGDNEYSDQCENYQGIGCDSDNGFALHTYTSDECNPKYFSGVSDTLYSLNQGMESIECTEIYNANSASDDSYGSALSLLKYSSACNYMNYWSPDGNCPDPYGKIKKYIKNYNNGIQRSHKNPYETYNKAVKKAQAFTVGGAIAFILAGITFSFFAGMSSPKQRNMIKMMREAMSGVGSTPKAKAQPEKAPPTPKPMPRDSTPAPTPVAAPPAPTLVAPAAGSSQAMKSKKKFGLKMPSFGSFGKKKPEEESVVDVDHFRDEISERSWGSNAVVAKTASHSSAEDV
jgi:hypothetical protein